MRALLSGFGTLGRYSERVSGPLQEPVKRASVAEPCLVAQHAARRRVAPQGLHGERPGRERDVLRRSLARADPRALVAVLGSPAVEPPAVGELVGDGLGELVALDDGDPRGWAQPVEVRPARGAGVGDV